MTARLSRSGDMKGPYEEYMPSIWYNSDHENEMVTYPKVSVGDTVFAMEWIQGQFIFEKPGICIYAGTPKDPSSSKGSDIGFFKFSSEFDDRPLHIFMPESSRKETVRRLNPSYNDIKSNVKIDGYYDEDKDCIVLTSRVDLVAVRALGPSRSSYMWLSPSPRKKPTPPVINDPSVALEFNETKPRLSKYPDSPDLISMVINLTGCAKVEETNPIVVGRFFPGTNCGEKLLKPYSTKLYNLETRHQMEIINISEDAFNIIKSNIKVVRGYSFDMLPTGDYAIHFQRYKKRGEVLQAQSDSVHITLNRKSKTYYIEKDQNDVIFYVMKMLISKFPHLNSTSRDNMEIFEQYIEVVEEKIQRAKLRL